VGVTTTTESKGASHGASDGASQPGRWDDLQLLIGGTFHPGAGPDLLVVDPATEEVAARVKGASLEQAEAAVKAARRAFDDGPWRRASGDERSLALHRLCDAFEKHAEELAEAIVVEAGSPISLARPLQVGAPLAHLRYYANAARRDWTEYLGPHFDPVPSDSLVAYRPCGVVSGITAYNFPLVLAAHKLAALAAGCTVVLMSSPRTPLATLLLGQIVAEAGLPDGVVNVVVGGADVARLLTEHPTVDKVTFTGSPEVGAMVMQQAGSALHDVVLELGGKSPAIILPDMDLADVVPDLHRRYCRNGGQGCAAPTRLLVHQDAWDTFVDVSRSMYDTIPVGDPWDPATIVGPMITSAHRDRVEGFVAEAVGAGAEVAAGGGRPDLPRGWYTNPALVIGAERSWRIAQEEIFGPVAVAFPYRTVDEAVAIANDTRYGLHAYVFTHDLSHALRVAEDLRAGSVTVNSGGGLRPDAPMGGFGISGVGREIGPWGIKEYLEPQHVQWPISL